MKRGSGRLRTATCAAQEAQHRTPLFGDVPAAANSPSSLLVAPGRDNLRQSRELPLWLGTFNIYADRGGYGSSEETVLVERPDAKDELSTTALP